MVVLVVAVGVLIADHFPPFIVLDFGNRGSFGMQIPEEFGGLGLTNRDFLRVLEQLAAIDLFFSTLIAQGDTLHYVAGTSALQQQEIKELAA